MLRTSLLPPLATPALSVLRYSVLISSQVHFFSPSNLRKISSFSPSLSFLPQTLKPSALPLPSPFGFKRLTPMADFPSPKASASFSAESGSGSGREILVQHLLVKEDDVKLLLDLQQRIFGGEDLSDLAVEYSICPSKDEGGMLGWVRKGQMVPEFEEAAFGAPLNKVVRCKTQFGWHLVQVLSEREESILKDIQPEELHAKIQDPSFVDEAQLIDVREPDEVYVIPHVFSVLAG
ncbi:hypothetical protein TIFTF001_034760 [Ficus carica]|uniref:Peptidyl-prolyl cis-trans isomerase n=1 Tax=Ficus carica TaxID=3494 RepID=A0AA88J997_FICCA|nr:hypothetical protein TIFTF001_034760 [Ficus carica]